MSVRTRLKPGIYQDSVRLMRISDELAHLPGVTQSVVGMATDANLRLLSEAGLLDEALAGAKSDDLVIAVEAGDDAAADAAVTRAEELLVAAAQPREGNGAGPAPARTLRKGVARLGGAEIAIVSVAGEYATLEAAHAIEAGCHVLLFSDNVSVEDERDLKAQAVKRRLLVMGPGAGTAIIDGVALAFANRVRSGPIGVVAGSGTGLQEFTVLVHRGGSGISQGIGTGGRDLRVAVGGLTTRLGLELLAEDPDTKVIALLSKPPEKAVADQVLAQARECGKPVVVGFLGGEPTSVQGENLTFARTLEEAATRALQALDGSTADPFEGRAGEIEELAAAAAAKLAPGQKYLRGLYSGGSLCDESLLILRDPAMGLGTVLSNAGGDPNLLLADAWKSEGHALVDLGEEEFTRGRPHPMIDPRLRVDRILQEGADPETAVLLLDVVIGYGSNDDPAGALAPAIREARAAAAAGGRELAVVAHVLGTDLDPQGLDRQEETLRAAGVIVQPTNAKAARLAGLIVSGRA